VLWTSVDLSPFLNDWASVASLHALLLDPLPFHSARTVGADGLQGAQRRHGIEDAGGHGGCSPRWKKPFYVQ
jgi:hypothetical protein